jgi:hypothetical protein
MALIRGNGVKMQSTLGCITRIVSRSLVSVKNNEQVSEVIKRLASVIEAPASKAEPQGSYRHLDIRFQIRLVRFIKTTDNTFRRFTGERGS